LKRTHHEENRQPAPHYSSGSPDTEPFHRSCSSRFSLSTFFWAARPAFYYMEFISPFVIAPFILLIATSYWPLYRVLCKKKNFPFADARSLLPSWITLLSLTAALLVSLP